MRYGIRTKNVEIEGELYKIAPLSGEFFADFMDIATKVETQIKEQKRNGVSDSELQIKLSKDDYKIMTELVVESLYAGDKTADKEQIKPFASQNLLLIFPTMMEVNSAKID
jgi:hypothetical protein